MKVLQIVTSAYRATIEEQDDTILWLTQALRNAGADMDVLLAGNAVNYTLRGQDASGIAIAGWRQTQPPRLDHDVAKLVEKGARVYAVEDDLAKRGLQSEPRVEDVEMIAEDSIPRLLSQYDQVWRW